MADILLTSISDVNQVRALQGRLAFMPESDALVQPSAFQEVGR